MQSFVVNKEVSLTTSYGPVLERFASSFRELNVAVLSSFANQGVTIVDHHTASRQFMCHEDVEAQAGRKVPAHWVWLVPPISGSTSPIFHVTHYHNTILKPNFFYQRPPWQGPQQGAARCPV